jgi:hypothetical protein
MRSPINRIALLLVALMAAGAMTAAASTIPGQDLTPTLPPPIQRNTTPTPTPTGPPLLRRDQPPTVIQPGRIYEGNYFGVPVEFLLDAELGQFLIIELTRADFDAVLELVDSGGLQVGYDDDSGIGNLPQIIFVAPSTGTFTVRLRGFSDPQEGSYILSVGGAVTPLPVGEAVTVEFDGTNSTIYAFEAEMGDVVNITADSGDTVDTTLRLIGPDGAQIVYVDDFTSVDPEFRRQPLGASGRYYLIHAPYSESAVGEVTLRIEKTELASLVTEPVFYPIDEGRDIFNIQVQADELYLITLTSIEPVNGTLEVIGIDGIGAGSVNYTNVEGASLFFRAAENGLYRVNVTLSNAADGAREGAFISIRPTGQ